MAARNTATGKKGKRSRFSFFSDITPEKKSAIYRYSGLAVFAFALLTFVSSLSYLFTWQADQNLLAHPEMMDKGMEVANWCGKLGYRWSEFLVGGCFGTISARFATSSMPVRRLKRLRQQRS